MESELLNASIPLQIAREVDKIYVRLAARRPDIQKTEDYALGNQPLAYATAEWKKANSDRYAGFSDNWCGTVISAEAERLNIVGVKALDDSAQKYADQLWRVLLENEYDSQFSQNVVTALTTSRSYVIVWPDENAKPYISVEHPASVEIEYDYENPRKRNAAIKSWVDEENEYLTLYKKDWLYKLQRPRMQSTNERESQKKQSRNDLASQGGGWRPRSDEWMVKNPYGIVPVVEIPNRPGIQLDPVSEISGVMPMQDAINLLWAYLFVAADYASMPARVLLGAEPPELPILDKEGKLVGKRKVDMKDLAEKRIFAVTGDSAKIDAWDAATLDVFTDVIEIAVGHIAAQTRTPPHYLVANKGLSNLPADALKAAEIGLVKKAKEFQKFASPAIREVLRLCVAIESGGDAKKMAAASLMMPVWENPEIRSEAQLADALVKKATLGYPLGHLLELDGYSPSEIKRISDMRDREAALDPIAQSARELTADDSEVDAAALQDSAED